MPGGGGMMKGGGRPMQPRAFDNNMFSAPVGSYSPSTTANLQPIQQPNDPGIMFNNLSMLGSGGSAQTQAPVQQQNSPANTFGIMYNSMFGGGGPAQTQAPNTNVEIPAWAKAKQQYGGAPSSSLNMVAQALGQPQIQPKNLYLPSGGPNVQQPIPSEVAAPSFAPPAPMPPQPMVVPPPNPQRPIPRPIMPRGMPPGLMSRLQRFGGF